MSILYKNKFRIPSNRLPGWDYTSAGIYFITIITHHRVRWFGKIENGRMKLSSIGKIIEEEWSKTAQIRQNITLDEWIIMPNHIHGIIIINDAAETTRRVVSAVATDSVAVRTLRSNSIGSIIGQFKSICTKRIWNMGFRSFRWQSRFHDRIIRNGKELNIKRKYVRSNPIHWHK